MNCMKCGRGIAESEAFCPKCLETMEKCPVKPDVVVQLPNRTDDAVRRPAPRKKVRTPEEQLKQLRKRNRILALIAAVLLLACSFLTYLSVDFFKQLDVQRFLGKNYSTVETTK